MPDFHFDFTVSGLTENQIGQLMVGIIEVVGICGGSLVEELRPRMHVNLAGWPGANHTSQADESAQLLSPERRG